MSPARERGHGSALSPSIVAGSARGWESLKPWVHPALWQISSWMPNPGYRRSARIARPACAALRRYTGRRNRRLVRGSRSFRSAKIVSRSWCLLVGFVGRCERADNALWRPSFQFRSGGAVRRLPDDLLQQRMEFCGLDGLLQHRRMRKFRDDGIGPVTGHECERDFSVGEDVGNRIGFFAPKFTSRIPACRLLLFAARMASLNRL